MPRKTLAPLDGFDLRILEELQENGDTGPQEMSQKVNLSASQCSRRMAQLRQAGYVARVATVLDTGRLNIGVKAYIMITFRSHEPVRIAEFIAQVVALDEVQECQSLTGSADILLKVATCDLASFNQFVNLRLLGASVVATTRSSIVLEDLKSTTRLPVRFAARK